MPNIDLSILNQRQTPAFYASSLATRPAFGFAGRIFIDTDSPSTGLYRDTGSAWVQIADPGAGTTGTLQQVTTNGNTTSQGINITAGGLSSNIVTIAANSIGSTANFIGQTMATNDYWKIYGNAQSVIDTGELVFEIGDNGSSGAVDRFRYTIYDGATLVYKDLLTLDFDESNLNTNLYISVGNSVGIGTNIPGAVLDVHSGVNVITQLNQTVSTNNSLLAFQNNNTGLWRIGSFYNAGANDFGIFDVVGAIQPVTIKKTTGQVLIGTSTVGSGKLVVASSTGDNGVQIVGASAPSLRIDNAESGPTKRVGLGISTATNNFIQGSTDRDFCIFNGSTTASPILFGIYDTTNVAEAARISVARNFLIGTTTDAGQKLQVNGNTKITSSTTNQLTLDGGTTVQSRIVIARGSDDNAQGMTIGYSNITSYRTSTPLASPQTDFSLNQQGSDGTRTVLYMSSAGNIGIGTITPGAKLEVVDTNGSQLLIGFGGVGANYYDATNHYFRATSGGATRLTINSSGNLLINTGTDNGNKLQIAGGASLTGVITQNGIYTRSKTLSGTANSSNVIFSISYGFPGAISGTVKVFAMAGIIGGGNLSTKVLTFNFVGANNAGGGAANSFVDNSVLSTTASADTFFTNIVSVTASITSATNTSFDISLTNVITGAQTTDPTYYIEVSYGLHGNASIS